MKKIIALTLALLMLAGCGATTVKTGLGAITTGPASTLLTMRTANSRQM